VRRAVHRQQPVLQAALSRVCCRSSCGCISASSCLQTTFIMLACLPSTAHPSPADPHCRVSAGVRGHGDAFPACSQADGAQHRWAAGPAWAVSGCGSRWARGWPTGTHLCQVPTDICMACCRPALKPGGQLGTEPVMRHDMVCIHLRFVVSLSTDPGALRGHLGGT